MNALPNFTSTNNFRRLWSLGYRRLVPIVPHDAALLPTSSLALRAGTSQDGRGKTPGLKGADGLWHSGNWPTWEATESSIDRWAAMGAGVGVRMGDGLHLIDVDTMNKVFAGQAFELITQHFGVLSCRVGNAPKAGYLIRVSGPLDYMRIDFGPLVDGKLERCEILGAGKQAVFSGIHPKTKAPYFWPFPLKPFDEIPVFTPAQVKAFLVELATILPAASKVITEGGGAVVDQARLKGDLATVTKAVRATPNTNKTFGARERYVEYGYAIKASLPDNEPEAFELFADWCSRWEEGTNDPAVVAAEWVRMKPPYRVGAGKLYELAEQENPAQFRKVDLFFDVIPEAEASLFAEPVVADEQKTIAPMDWIDPTEWEGRPLRAREWVVEGWVPKGEVTFLYGDGGVGKSLLAQQLATCAATGRDWLGQPTTPSRVMCFFCEDSADELHRRQSDINRAVGVGFSDLSSLRLISRKHMDNLFSLWDRHTGAMREQVVWRQLLADAKAFSATVLVVDTIADTYSGSEIDRGQVNVFVKSVLGRLAEEIGGSVIALGHPSKSGKSTGDGTSGSTAWSNAARSRLYLRHPTGAASGNIRELEGMKLNYGPKGSVLKLRWSKGAFDVLAGSRPAGAPAIGAQVQTIGDAAENAVVSVLLANPTARLDPNPRSQYFRAKVLRRLDPDALAPYTPDEAEGALQRLENRKAIRAEKVGRDASYRPAFGYVVVPDNLASAEPVRPTLFD